VSRDIVDRINRGEQVSPEEIAEASRKAEEEERYPSYIEERDDRITQTDGKKEAVNEWLPDSIQEGIKGAKKRKGRRK